MGLTEPVVGLEVLQSLVKISLWIAIQPTGLLAWLKRSIWDADDMVVVKEEKKMSVDFHYVTKPRS
jgi:hypothetical protein